MVAADRPGFGQSSPHAARSFFSFANDTYNLMSALRIRKFHIVATGNGASYALALAAYLPKQVRATFLWQKRGCSRAGAHTACAGTGAGHAGAGGKLPASGHACLALVCASGT